MRRRNFITGIGGVGAGLAAASTMPTPAIAQGTRELRMVSTFVKNFPGLGTSANRLVERIRIASDGKLRIRLYNANELVGPLEVFDVVSKGDADIYFSSEYYYLGKSKAFGFFGAVPFGLTMDEYYAWLHYGGGQQLWDELSAQFNLKPFVSSNTGVQMGGWFNREIKTVDDFKGLKFRMPGIGGEVLRRMGAAVVTLPPPEIYQALQSGTIDATEWIGPWHDLAFGFYKIAKFYYWPGFHEPSSVTSYAINMRVWNGLPKDQQELLKMAFEFGGAPPELRIRCRQSGCARHAADQTQCPAAPVLQRDRQGDCAQLRDRGQRAGQFRPVREESVGQLPRLRQEVGRLGQDRYPGLSQRPRRIHELRLIGCPSRPGRERPASSGGGV